MNTFKMISAIALTVTVLAISATPVAADGVTTTQTCTTTGAYGQRTCQDTNVKTDDKVVTKTCDEYETREDGTKVCVHKTEQTALDPQTMAIALGTMLTGVAGAVVKIKNRA